MLKLVELSEQYREAFMDMMTEWRATGERIIPSSLRTRDYHDFEGYLDFLRDDALRDDEAHVPASTLFLMDDETGRFLGSVNIRHKLNAHLLLYGGHVGDGIRPSERGKGYATKMIALALCECRKLGITRVLMTCDKDNLASARTIQKNGGVLENEVLLDGKPMQRYWIDNA